MSWSINIRSDCHASIIMPQAGIIHWQNDGERFEKKSTILSNIRTFQNEHFLSKEIGRFENNNQS